MTLMMFISREFTLYFGLVLLLLAVCQPKEIEQSWPRKYDQINAPRDDWQYKSIAKAQPTGELQRGILEKELQHLRDDRKMLTTQVVDELSEPTDDNNNKKSNQNNFVSVICTAQPQPLQTQTKFNRKPTNYYNNNMSKRAAALTTKQQQFPSQSQPRTSGSDNYGKRKKVAADAIATNGNSSFVEQFETINTSERSARTFTYISNLFENLFPSCIDPCTIVAYYENRCCITLAAVSPPIPPPILPQPLPLGPATINCCNTCNYGFYGPQPCNHYGGVGGFGGGVGGSGLYLGGGIGNLAYGGLGISLRPLG